MASTIKMMERPINRLRKLDERAGVTEVARPFHDTIGALYAEPDQPGLLMSLSAGLPPPESGRSRPDRRLVDTGRTPRPNMSTTGIGAHCFFAIVWDGTRNSTP